ncbi:MAG: ABC transporter permease [Eubacteriales bacterium]|nr:ABC transporter permease [Eubacteriales bacterium]
MSRRWALVPYIVTVITGTVFPLLMIVYYGFTDRNGAFSLSNILAVFQYAHIKALGYSLLLSGISTAVCLCLAFPLAIVLKNIGVGRKGFVIFIFILPMWMNFMLRTMAWQVILEKGGIIASFLSVFHIPMIPIINTPAAVVLGMVYDFLPFMVLPIYNVMLKIDKNVVEAAYDLGASKSIVLRKIIFPLSIPGIASGVTMVFVPSLTTFVLSNILGGGKIYLIGNIIEQEFTVSANWNLGSGLSLVMMLFIIVSMMIVSKFDKSGEGGLL